MGQATGLSHTGGLAVPVCLAASETRAVQKCTGWSVLVLPSFTIYAATSHTRPFLHDGVEVLQTLLTAVLLGHEHHVQPGCLHPSPSDNHMGNGERQVFTRTRKEPPT